MKGLPYEVKSLLIKARESALLAVETYNRPSAHFRSGAYVVLMIIAWTSLFHALFIAEASQAVLSEARVTPFPKSRWRLSAVGARGVSPAAPWNPEPAVAKESGILHCRPQ